MIIVTLVLMGISLIVFVVMNRQKESVWLSGLFVGFILTNIGLLFYYSKTGGLTYNEQILFFLNPKWQTYIQTSVVTLDSVARLLNIGRHLFVYFALMFSLGLTGKLSHKKAAVLLLLWPLFNVITGDPYFYSASSEPLRAVFDLSGVLCIFLHIAVSLFLLIREYFSYSVGWIRKKLRYIILFVVNLMVYFLLFCQINASSIFYSSNIRFLNLGFKIYLLRFSLTAWVLIVVLFVFFLIVGLNSLLLYAKINIDETREQISLERQLTTANMGTRVFIHGIKNQLLAERILINRMEHDIANLPADSEHMEKHLRDLSTLNANMSSRIEALYKAFKYNSMTLTPHLATEIVKTSMEKLTSRAGAPQCQLEVSQDSLILADLNYLSEALDNILSNAVDAIKSSPRKDCGKIIVTLKKDRRYCTIMIADNGTGMSRATLAKIFEPFYTDKNTNFSWGIGLSYVKQTVKYHFGRLHVESKEGEGTTFMLAFPLYIQKNNKSLKGETE